jgi:hypothetical protein
LITVVVSTAVLVPILSCCCLLVKILLEASEGFIDLVWSATEIGNGIPERVVVFEPEQRGELFLIEFFHTHRDVMLEHEIEEHLLLGAEPGIDVNLCICGPDFAGERRQGVGNMGTGNNYSSLPS